MSSPGAAEGHIRPTEDRSYLIFAGTALGFALLAGLSLGLLAAFAPALGWHLSEEALVRAHASTELEGWLGLFIAGMGLRLVPRLARRPPPPRALTLAVFVGLTGGAAGILLADLASGTSAARSLTVLASGCEGAGLLLFAVTIARALWVSRRPTTDGGWRSLVWMATFWWAAWGVLSLARAVAGASGLSTTALDAVSLWIALLGAVCNLIWAVQARSVPVFYGRRPPTARVLAAPLLLANVGMLMVLLSLAPPASPLLQPGLALAGLGTLWMAPVAGAVHGQAHRLRPPSRPAAALVLLADRWAVVAGFCLVLGAALSGSRARELTGALDQAAVHALGLGLATTLIVGMALLLAPVFAIARAVPGRQQRPVRVTWGMLLAATSCRMAAALLKGRIPTDLSLTLLSLAGLLTLGALGLFAVRFTSAWAHQASWQVQLRRAASSGTVPRDEE